MSRHRTLDPRSRPAVLLVLTAVVFGSIVTTAWAVATDEPPVVVTTAAPTSTAPSPLTVRTALVTEVPDANTVVVDRRETIRIAGVVSPTGQQCGAEQALENARNQLLGARITLVPDPAMPGAGMHVVLPSQLSFTDQAIAAGMGRPQDGPWTYQGVFRREAAEAADGERGLWAEDGCWDPETGGTR